MSATSMNSGAGCLVTLAGAVGASGSGAVSALLDFDGFFLLGVVGTKYGAKMSQRDGVGVELSATDEVEMPPPSFHGPQPLVGPTPRSTTSGRFRRAGWGYGSPNSTPTPSGSHVMTTLRPDGSVTAPSFSVFFFFGAGALMTALVVGVVVTTRPVARPAPALFGVEWAEGAGTTTLSIFLFSSSAFFTDFGRGR